MMKKKNCNASIPHSSKVSFISFSRAFSTAMKQERKKKFFKKANGIINLSCKFHHLNFIVLAFIAISKLNFNYFKTDNSRRIFLTPHFDPKLRRAKHPMLGRANISQECNRKISRGLWIWLAFIYLMPLARVEREKKTLPPPLRLCIVLGKKIRIVLIITGGSVFWVSA